VLALCGKESPRSGLAVIEAEGGYEPWWSTGVTTTQYSKSMNKSWSRTTHRIQNEPPSATHPSEARMDYLLPYLSLSNECCLQLCRRRLPTIRLWAAVHHPTRAAALLSPPSRFLNLSSSSAFIHNTLQPLHSYRSSRI
jgi:hypothetical protein